jgi:hypothetical protein
VVVPEFEGLSLKIASILKVSFLLLVMNLRIRFSPSCFVREFSFSDFFRLVC